MTSCHVIFIYGLGQKWTRTEVTVIMISSLLFTRVQEPPASAAPQGAHFIDFNMSCLTSAQLDKLFFYYNLNEDLIWLLDEYLFDPFEDEW